ncbi:outer membrane receptor for ferric coprogen and ferric-rhodotorulic acid [Paucibacter oligotrophus]|uniref:Outer membrane receptor for ferric coprogen and ferric-rhodotorulic acid n=1 Tax=Roseateles oligotrophus TaxID=1769250 RepID=A0A840LI98_9BURK|nr:TonB-dependent receptor [Roseateles oligotrophus]MBB4845928.1 outer membrane receptor for ferric coprogen and ferric-rhodotorulic acid [Roseateles oligotrophus]
MPVTLRNTRLRLHPVALALALASWAGSGHAQTGAAPQAAVRVYNIPAGPLAEALNRFAQAAGLSIAVDAGRLAGLRSPGLSGSHSPASGFAELLRGSGYEAARTEVGYVLRPAGPAPTPAATAAPAAAPAAPAIEPALPVVRARVQALRASSEGSASYTVPITSAATGLSLGLRDTPQSVTVLTRQRLDDQGVLDLGQALAQTPGVSTNQGDTERADYSARGFEINNFLIDGVPVRFSESWGYGIAGLDMALFDRVEVVRGAAGLLTGSGAPAAAVNLLRKHADSKTLAGELSLGLGSWGLRRAEADVSTPLSADGRWRARLVATHQEQESYTRMYSRKKTALYGVVDVDLSPGTRLSLGLDWRQTAPRGVVWGGTPMWFSDGTPIPVDRGETTTADWTFWDNGMQSAFAQLEQRLAGGWKLKASATRIKGNVDAVLFYVSGAPDRLTGLGLEPGPNRYKGTSSSDTLDLQASGPFSAWGRRHELMLGANLAREQSRNSGHDSLTKPAVPTGPYPQWDGRYPRPDFSASPSWTMLREDRLAAAYAATRLSLSDSLKAVLGTRLSSQKVRREESGVVYQDHHKAILTPYAGLVQDLGEQVSAYLSHTAIFQPQTERDWQARTLTPIRGNSQELGLKGEFLDGELNASLALFRIQQDNLAQPDPRGNIPGAQPAEQAFVEALGARTQGVEAEISGQLAPQWQASLGLAHFKASDASGQAINTQMPRTQLKLFTSYRLGGALQGLTLGGGLNWQSRFYAGATHPLGQQVEVEQQAYALLNLMARYEINRHWQASLHIDNALDKTYQTGLFSSAIRKWGEPRSLNFSASYRF